MAKKKQKIFILADGEKMKPHLLKKLARGRKILAVDGAAKQAIRLGWSINFAMGDFDSLGPSILQFLERKGTRIVLLPDQNFTDLEKAVGWCIQEGYRDIRIAQALGKRMDHCLTNLALLKKFHLQEVRLEIFTARERIIFLKNSTTNHTGRKNRLVGVIPAPYALATSKGLAWEMTKSKLIWGESQSVSNKASRLKFSLKIKGEAFLIEGT